MRSEIQIWTVEDDAGCRVVYEEVLALRYRLRQFENLASFSAAIVDPAEPHPDLIIADLRLPDGCFLDVLASNDGAVWLTCPFVIASWVDDLDVLRECFQEGALDYISKPFGRGELIVKVEKLLAMSGASPLPPSFILPGAYTPREEQILATLRRAPDRTSDRDTLISSVWRGAKVIGKNLDVHLFNLRRKIRPVGFDIRHTSPKMYTLVRTTERPRCGLFENSAFGEPPEPTVEISCPQSERCILRPARSS